MGRHISEFDLSFCEFARFFSFRACHNIIVVQYTSKIALKLMPHVGSRLIQLSILRTGNAQAPYILRNLVTGGTLPSLRKLKIHLVTSSHTREVDCEGARWREDERGNVTKASKKKAVRWFDENYFMSLALAAPFLEELELIGTYCGTLAELTSSLCRFPRLHTFVVKGGLHGFFESSAAWPAYVTYDLADPQTSEYRPGSFDEAAIDIARGVPTLEWFTIRGRFDINFSGEDQGCQILRDAKGDVDRMIPCRVTQDN